VYSFESLFRFKICVSAAMSLIGSIDMKDDSCISLCAEAAGVNLFAPKSLDHLSRETLTNERVDFAHDWLAPTYLCEL